MNPLWFAIFSPNSRYSTGHLEVVDGVITGSSPAYRWAVGLEWEKQKKKWDSGGYRLTTSRVRHSSLDSKQVYKKPKPTARELYKRVSP